MKYKFSICRSIASLLIALFLIYAIQPGRSTYHFFDPPSLIITFGLCFLMMLIVYEVEFLKFIPHALRILFSRPLETNPRFSQIALFGSRSAIGAGLIGMLIRIIQMLSNLSDPSGVGIGMAFSFLCPLYTIFLSEIFFAMVHQSFKIKPLEKEENTTLPLMNAGLPLLLILFSVAMFMVLSFNYYIWYK